jgi:hypothetical protein
MIDADLTDVEIDKICAGLVQNAARVRFLKRMGLHVRQKPNGRPLVNRAHYDAATAGQKATPTLNGPTFRVAA